MARDAWDRGRTHVHPPAGIGGPIERVDDHQRLPGLGAIHLDGAALRRYEVTGKPTDVAPTRN